MSCTALHAQATLKRPCQLYWLMQLTTALVSSMQIEVSGMAYCQMSIHPSTACRVSASGGDVLVTFVLVHVGTHRAGVACYSVQQSQP